MMDAWKGTSICDLEIEALTTGNMSVYDWIWGLVGIVNDRMLRVVCIWYKIYNSFSVVESRASRLQQHLVSILYRNF